MKSPHSVVASPYQSWVSMASAIAVLLVVFRHVLHGIGSDFDIPIGLEIIHDGVYPFAMPVFFVLAGMFIRSSLSRRSNGTFVKYKAASLLYPFLLWSILQITIQIILSNYTNANRSLTDYLYIFTQPRAIDQMWYFNALFNVTMLFMLLNGVWSIPRWLQLVISILMLYLSVFFKDYSLVRDFFYYYFFILAGDYVSRWTMSNRKVHPVLLIVMISLFILVEWVWLTYGYIHVYVFVPIALIGVGCVILVAQFLAQFTWMKWLEIVGINWIYIYLAHALCSSPIRLILTKFIGVQQVYIVTLITFGSAVIFPMLMYLLAKKFKMEFIFKSPWGLDR